MHGVQKKRGYKGLGAQESPPNDSSISLSAAAALGRPRGASAPFLGSTGLPRLLARSVGPMSRPLPPNSPERGPEAVPGSIAQSSQTAPSSRLHGPRCPSRSHMPAPELTHSRDAPHHCGHLVTSAAWSGRRKPVRGGAQSPILCAFMVQVHHGGSWDCRRPRVESDGTARPDIARLTRDSVRRCDRSRPKRAASPKRAAPILYHCHRSAEAVGVSSKPQMIDGKRPTFL